MPEHDLPICGTTSDGAAIQISEEPIGCLTQVAGWDTFTTSADEALRSQGLALPTDFRISIHHGLVTVWRIAPDRVLVRSDVPLKIASSSELVVLDLSEARVCLVLKGAGATSLLSRVIALDFSEASFPIGCFAQTAMHHVGVLVERFGQDEFGVFIPTTWATSLMDLMANHLSKAA